MARWAPAAVTVARDGPLCLQAPGLAAIAGVAHGFFGRRGGVSAGPFDSLNTGELVGDDAACVVENRARVARALGLEPAALVALRQEHAARVIEVDASGDTEGGAQVGDALITGAAGVGLAVKTADCVPSLVASVDGALVAAVHTGWRGLAAGLIQEVVEAFAERGHKAAALRVAVGPHIGACCYQVGAEVVAALGPQARVERGGRLCADLGAEAVAQWCAAGVPREAVERAGPCVSCDAAGYFSHRRDRGRSGRQLSAIARVVSPGRGP